MATATTTTRGDQEIQRDALEELRWDARVRPAEIGVVVQDGVVTLTGWVDSYARKWAAERAVHRMRGVRAVANDVEVRLTPTTERTDTDIALAAGRALEWDSFVPDEGVEVTVANAWVMLRGEVEWAHQRRAAERAARRLTGVRGVTNLVVVRPSDQPSPDRLREDIREALLRGVAGDVNRIVIDVQGDTVVLAGTVRSWMEREEAERVAWSAPGVNAVDDRLTVAV